MHPFFMYNHSRFTSHVFLCDCADAFSLQSYMAASNNCFQTRANETLKPVILHLLQRHLCVSWGGGDERNVDLAENSSAKMFSISDIIFGCWTLLGGIFVTHITTRRAEEPCTKLMG